MEGAKFNGDGFFSFLGHDNLNTKNFGNLDHPMDECICIGFLNVNRASECDPIGTNVLEPWVETPIDSGGSLNRQSLGPEFILVL